MSTRVSDWLPFGCGDIVREPEGRHEARVERVRSSLTIDVRWTDSGWLSTFAADDLVLVRRA